MEKRIIHAGIIDFNLIEYLTKPDQIINPAFINVYEEDNLLNIIDISFNHDMHKGIIKIDQKIDLTKNYTLDIKDYETIKIIPTKIFDTLEFIENYTYDKDDLGANIINNKTLFKLWAPTAKKIELNLFKKGHDTLAYKKVEMKKKNNGIWESLVNCGHGTYYTYTLTNSWQTFEVVDPYAKSSGVNGKRGMVVDFSLTNPIGLKSHFLKTISSYQDAVIWEVHIRDFSNKIKNSLYKGKYLAFTEDFLVNSHNIAVGLDYLVNLGITHVHLLPIFDFETVDEENPNKQFNWGYDPKNYNVLEGSYATSPYDGIVRIKEFKQLVSALHNKGIGVIMDVVYNHTYNLDNSLNKIVPYYYYRYKENGELSNASGCGNDTASERIMFRKFMIDSVKFWLEEYKLDGFRFDLMGLHDLETMQKVEEVVHKINPNAIIYGEGWKMGFTLTNVLMANQSNIAKITPSFNGIGSIAVFNDEIRDGLKGSVFSNSSKGYISGNLSKDIIKKIKFGITGTNDFYTTWSVKNAMVINYMSAHDNHTLWDKLLLSTNENSDDERIKMNKIGALILMISRGTPFFQAGEEMLRTKNKEENSYSSSDEINNLDWESLTPNSNQYKMMNYYKELIALRKTNPIFKNNHTVITFNESLDNILEITYQDPTSFKQAKVFINPSFKTNSFNLNGIWRQIASIDSAALDILLKKDELIYIYPLSASIYVNY